jgi:hypothetical protein
LDRPGEGADSMSAIDVIRSMGADVAWVDGAVEVMGLDVLPADVAEHVIVLAREHREELVRELSGASAPGPVTGLEWVSYPPFLDTEKYGGQWAAFDLADLGKLYGVRVVRASERILAVFQPSLEPELVAYASELLAEAQGFLRQHQDRLPVLDPAEAVKIILATMRAHKGLRFCRGSDGSRWPIFPKRWTAGQKATVQSLWLVAGPALDVDFFEGVD